MARLGHPPGPVKSDFDQSRNYVWKLEPEDLDRFKGRSEGLRRIVYLQPEDPGENKVVRTGIKISTQVNPSC